MAPGRAHPTGTVLVGAPERAAAAYSRCGGPALPAPGTGHSIINKQLLPAIGSGAFQALRAEDGMMKVKVIAHCRSSACSFILYIIYIMYLLRAFTIRTATTKTHEDHMKTSSQGHYPLYRFKGLILYIRLFK